MSVNRNAGQPPCLPHLKSEPKGKTGTPTAWSSTTAMSASYPTHYDDWRVRHTSLLGPAQAYVPQFLATFREFPPRQEARMPR